MAIIQKAGAIIFSQKRPFYVALFYRSKQDDWSFPKGHVERDESVVETARREVMEETGLQVRVLGNELPPMEYDHPNGDHILVHMFLMQSEDDSALNADFQGNKISWVLYKEVVNRLSYSNTKQYYMTVVGQLEKIVRTL